MSLEEVFQNLTSEEFEQASNWCNNLREPEKERISETLGFLNKKEFNFEFRGFCGLYPKKMGIAIIVAGSSIDTKCYSDIDLFLLTNETLDNNRSSRTAPKTKIWQEFCRDDDPLPSYVHYIVYRKTRKTDFLPPEPPTLEEISLRGANVTISLFYEMDDFKRRRTDHPDDLIEPCEPLGAEDIIKHNRDIDSKFLVLSRQYKPE